MILGDLLARRVKRAKERGLAVLLFFNPAMFRTTFEIAAGLREHHGYESLLYCPTYLPETERYRGECDAAGLMFVSGMTKEFAANDIVADVAARYAGRVGKAAARRHAHDRSFSPDAHFAAMNPQLAWSEARGIKAIEWIARRSGTSLDGKARAEFEERWQPELESWATLYLHITHDAQSAFRALGPDLVVCAEENVDYNSAVFTDAIVRLGRPSVCFSSALPTAKEAAAYYYERPEHQLPASPFARFFAKALPGWVYRFEGRALTRFPMMRAVAMELYGLAPRHPWIINTGASEIVAVESPFMKELFHDLGVETFPGRVQDLGHPALDQLHRVARRKRAIRAEVCASHGLDPAKPIALFSVPTDQYATTPAPGFASYEDLLRHWVESMARMSNYSCLITAHPAISRKHLQGMRAQGAAIVEKSAADVLPICDVFVASVSTTIKWARAIGKPVVNYDCYRMKYDEADRKSYLEGFDHIYGARDAAGYFALLDRFNRPADARRIIQAAGRGSEYWGRVDGRALRRIAKAFDAAAERARKGRDARA
jgi:hypothetical protein